MLISSQFAARQEGRERFKAADMEVPQHLLPENDIQAAYDHGMELFCYEEAFELTQLSPKRIRRSKDSRHNTKAKPPSQADLGEIPRTLRKGIDNSMSLAVKVIHATTTVNSAAPKWPGGVPSGGGFAGLSPKFPLP